MKTIYYSAASRGHKDYGWLVANYSFSFANYYDPNRINFGALRVLNDDIIQGGEGFGTHPHDNMEIVTIPLSGALAHKDSMGHAEVIRSGEIQVMSAGTGITHSEYNANKDIAANTFQIWIFPEKQNVKPRYNQKGFDFVNNQLTQLISPEIVDGNLWLNQKAWLSMGTFDDNITSQYQIKKEGNGVFAIVIEGSFEIGEYLLSVRDALGIWETESIQFTAKSKDSKILLIDIPMSF